MPAEAYFESFLPSLDAIMFKLQRLLSLLPAALLASALNVTDIQGPASQSPYAGQNVSLVGTVSATSKTGFWLAGFPSEDVRVSSGLYVFTNTSTVVVGDLITLDGLVAEYRSNSRPADLRLTELTGPQNINVISQNNTVTPVVLGQDRSPPTQSYSALDVGPDGIFSLPNNASLIESVNATLQPDLYGLDFWESLEGQLVQIPSPVSLNFPNQYGEFWVYGAWNVTGKNARGGLTITFGPDGTPDANPEVLIVDSPLDGSKSPDVPVGATLSDITGIITYQFGFYYVLPLTAPTVISLPDFEVPATTITKSSPSELFFGDYNIENMSPTSAHLPVIAEHIVSKLKTPDLLFVQEVQDNSGETSDGVVSANLTLSTLVAAIKDISNVTYEWTQIDPEDGKDGGVPGGNIRQAYLYQPDLLTLVDGATAGTATEATEVTAGEDGKPTLSLNPGRIDPANDAWASSRKPLVAEWVTANGASLFTINLHLASKGGSSSTQGDARPPVNSPSEARTAQVAAVAAFVQSILDISSDANIIVAGDFNEFVQTRGVIGPIAEVLTEIDEAAGIPAEERYTYVFDQNSQQLDHAFISSGIIAAGEVKAEHVHINSWSTSYDARISDHDPTVARVTLV